MEIQFDNSKSYQLDAIDAIVSVFDGQPLAGSGQEIALETSDALFNELGRGNVLELSDDALLANVQAVQERNSLPPTIALDGRNFTIEMETGTGKTYVYLRTIYELFQRYGWTKFIIVVPSIAIREGVLASLRQMKKSFDALYHNAPCNSWVYDSKRVSTLRQFAGANTLQILIMNLQAFDKASTIMQKDSDRMSGRRPIEFIQAANPIVILDEPQNMESANAKKAIETLNPLCTLRYSATHRNRYNLLYRLGPVQAYDLNLVKKIVVDSVVESGDFNRPYICVESITSTKSKVTAKLLIDTQAATGPARKTVSVSNRGDSLVTLSGGREVYSGYVIDEINAGENWVRFDNGIELAKGEEQASNKDQIMREQIFETVREHFAKELKIFQTLPEGERLKVLSLFFIDRVANYAPADGKIRQWFIEAYRETAAKPIYQCLNPLPVDQVHNGYFAEDRGIAKDSQEGRDSQADDAAYQKIMRGKEQLLQMAEPLRFIFSHSALREGWDNPNVFQICTLNETRSEMKKRQEIGRGLRLPVNEQGNQSFDTMLNRLTVVVNENYSAFAKALQSEIEEDTGEKFTGRIANARDRRKANLIPSWRDNPYFSELWKRIQYRTRYSVEYSTAALIDKAAEYVRASPETTAPATRTAKTLVILQNEGIAGKLIGANENNAGYTARSLPDILGYLQRETRLTRGTLAQILKQSGRCLDIPINPQQFLDHAVRAIKRAKQELMIDGIKYEKVEGTESVWNMLRFEQNEINSFADRMVDAGKSLYDAIVYDSDTERKFAEGMETREDIKFYLKLPDWFKIETPLGTYNPDWAIVKQDAGDPRLYLVRETKSSTRQFDIRNSETSKIDCGKAHFRVTPDIDFAKVTDPADI